MEEEKSQVQINDRPNAMLFKRGLEQCVVRFSLFICLCGVPLVIAIERRQELIRDLHG